MLSHKYIEKVMRFNAQYGPPEDTFSPAPVQEYRNTGPAIRAVRTEVNMVIALASRLIEHTSQLRAAAQRVDETIDECRQRLLGVIRLELLSMYPLLQEGEVRMRVIQDDAGATHPIIVNYKEQQKFFGNDA